MHPIIVLAGIICSTIVIVAAMAAVSARHITQRRMSSQTLANDEIARRLERIEQIAEATAVEVERLGESSRFLTRLLADKRTAVRTDGR
jgi:hypothetical protein